MKTKEFIKRVEELGYFVNSFKGYYEIRDVDKVIIAVINKTIFLQFSTDYLGWDKLCDKDRKELYNLVIKYASTPIEDREEEKKFYLRHRYFRFYNGSSKYLGMDFVKVNLDLCSKITYRWVKNQFTEKEIYEIKEKFNTDLGDFEKTEVEDENKNKL